MNRRDSLKLLLAASGTSLIPSALAASPHVSDSPRNDEVPAQARGASPVFTSLPWGEVKPAGWLKEQMSNDLTAGFAGCLDALCKEASSDIFVTGRNTAVKANTTNAAGSNWWNGETEGNWRAGFFLLAYLSEDQAYMAKADRYVEHILASQDADGYLGVFAPDLRFSKPGELWTQACLFRGLLAYAEITGNQKVREAVLRAAHLTMSIYAGGRTPLASGPGGEGESHDLMFSDVMETLFDQTGDVRYRDFTIALYQQLSLSAKNSDTSLKSLLTLDSGYKDHGVNTYETMRVPLWLWMATRREDFGTASRNSFSKLARYTECSGSAVSGESIEDRKPDPTLSEYEYCSTKEIQVTLQSALQKTGVASLGDQIERVFFNAAQGSRLADGKAISYLTADNRLHLDGTSPDGMTSQHRNRFSPTHTNSAVCCNPNATLVAPHFVHGMWLRHSSGGLAAVLYGPCKVATKINGITVRIEERTMYPFRHTVDLDIRPESATEFPLYLRNPGWSYGTTVTCDGAAITQEGDYWVVRRKWTGRDTVRITFRPTVKEVPAVNGEVALQYGALLFAQPVAAHTQLIHTYPVAGFEDVFLLPTPGADKEIALPATLRWNSFGLKAVFPTEGVNSLRPFEKPVITLQGTAILQTDGTTVPFTLVPLGNAPMLRRLTLPVSA